MKRIPKTILITLVSILVLGGIFAWSKKDALASFVVNSWQGYKLTQGLVGYWSFNGSDIDWNQNTAFDRSGAGNNGTIANMSTGTSPVAGKIGQGLNFDGVNDAVNVGMPSSLNIIGEMSLFGWVKTKSAFPGGSIASQSSASFYGLFQLDITSGDTVNVTWGDALVHSSSVFVSEDEWHQVGFVRSGSIGNWTDTIYLDGVPAETLTNIVIDPDAHGQEATSIGKSIGSGTFFKGIIDEVRIYNRTLSADEAKRLYQMGSSLKQNVTHRDELTSGLAGYWTFDGKDMNLSSPTAEVLDVSGNGNNGDWQNHATTTTVGKIGQAIDFDGVNDYIDMGNPASLQITGSYSISAWIYSTGYPASSDHPILFKAGSTAVDCAYGFAVSNDNGFKQVYMQVSSDGTCTLGATSGQRYTATNIATSTWYHVVGVYDASLQTIHIYTNGVLDDGTLAGTVPASVFNAPGNALIGHRVSNLGYFAGKLDDVRIYNRSLSANEVKRLYQMGNSLKENTSPRFELTSGLVGYWTFDGKDIDWSQRLNVKDSSGNSNTGSTTNMSTTTSPAVGKIGQGLNFDGVNDYVDVGAGATLTDLGDETRSMWIYPRSLGGTNFGTVMVSEGAASRWYIQMCNSDATECPGTASTFVFMSNGATGAQWEWYAPANTIKLNQWQLITITYTCGTTPTFYYNGSPITAIQSQAGPGNCVTYDGGINQWIGDDRVGASQFDGIIDDVRVYNRKLSASEVRQLYLMGK